MDSASFAWNLEWERIRHPWSVAPEFHSLGGSDSEKENSKFLGGRTSLVRNKCIGKSWSLFRNAMNKEDQETFGRLFDRAKLHTHAAVYQAHSFPRETILLSICLEHGKMLEEILRKLKAKC